MAMLYTDEMDGVSALGKGGYVYDAVAQGWGMGNEVDGRPIRTLQLPSMSQDTYGGSQLEGCDPCLRQTRCRPSPRPSPFGMGANIFEAIGLKSAISKEMSRGIPLAQIFAKWSSVLNAKASDIPRVPKGSIRSALERTASTLQRQRDRLAGAFAPGARAGSEDQKSLSSFVGAVKGFRSAVNAAVKRYGLRVLPDAAGAPDEEMVEPMVVEAGVGIPMWAWLAGGAGLILLLARKN